MPGCHVQRKHLRVNLGGLHAFVAHQALQRLQRYPRVKHVHGVAVAEGVRRHRHGERDSVTGCGGFIQPGPHRPVSYRPKSGLLGPARLRVATLKRNFQRGDHHLQLGHVLRIGQRNQPVRDHA